jgi:FkbM family methyltransferase
MAFVLHALREEDVFGDIGANIGVYTILASKNTGAKTIAVEPIASTSKRLSQNVELNNVSGLVTLHTCGVGAIRGTLRFTSTADTVNHVVNENEMGGEGAVVEVPVIPLDEIFAGISPAILKMDIEGFEWPALQGGGQLLGSPSLKAIIIELNGSGARYGYSDEQIDELLLSYGFKTYTYDPFFRKFSPQAVRNDVNTLYIKDLDWATRRCSAARKFIILEQEV